MARRNPRNNRTQRERLFLDTSYAQGLLNKNDQYHIQALRLFERVQAAEIWITEAVILEIGNAFSRINRPAASAFIRQCYQESRITVVPIETHLLQDALTLFEQHNDQTWGLVDCISFVVMRQNGLNVAITADRHFIQMGFQALMREG